VNRKNTIQATSKTPYPFGMHMPGKTVLSLSIEQEEVLSKMMKYTQNITYPFGMHMPGRSFSSGSYRYGFQGQEKDDEIKGEGNSINYKYRMHDPRLGRFLSIDPLYKKYPFYSPYAFSGNRLIDMVEQEGLQPQNNRRPVDPNNPNSVAIDNTAQPVKVNSTVIENIESQKPEWMSDSAWKATKNAGDNDGEIKQKVNILDVVNPQNIGLPRSSLSTVQSAFEVAATEIVFTKVATIGVASLKYLKFAAKGVTTTDGFLFKGITLKTPVNIPVQRFGNMSLKRPDIWGARIGKSQFVNRTFGAIKPAWNPLTQYTTGVIPRGTKIKFGIIGPQGWRYPGGSFQFRLPSRSVINQSSIIIPR
jgi:RHS repeat-associated protein